MKLTVHTIVKNEDRWIWFALQSVLPFVDKIIVYDTGSTDRTVEIIKSIKSSKIDFYQMGEVSKKDLVALRQKQIDMTKTEWFMLLDGDEIWSETQLKKLLETAEHSNPSVKAVFNKTRNSIGDVFHYLPESAGKYNIAGLKGHLNLRLIRKTESVQVIGEYPLEIYADDQGPLVEQVDKLVFADCWYLHTSFLNRSSLNQKTSGSLGKAKKWESGLKLKESELPEVLFKPYPKNVANPLSKRSLSYEVVSKFTTPLINFKRKWS